MQKIALAWTLTLSSHSGCAKIFCHGEKGWERSKKLKTNIRCGIMALYFIYNISNKEERPLAWIIRKSHGMGHFWASWAKIPLQNVKIGPELLLRHPYVLMGWFRFWDIQLCVIIVYWLPNLYTVKSTVYNFEAAFTHIKRSLHWIRGHR